MANGSTRTVLAEMELNRQNANTENEQLKKMDKTLPKKMPLKYPSEHNHSK